MQQLFFECGRETLQLFRSGLNPGTSYPKKTARTMRCVPSSPVIEPESPKRRLLLP